MGPLAIFALLGLGMAALSGGKSGNRSPGAEPGPDGPTGPGPMPGGLGGTPEPALVMTAQRLLAKPAPMSADDLTLCDSTAAQLDTIGRADLAAQLRSRATADRALLQGSGLLAQITQLLNLPPGELPPVPGPLQPGAPVAPAEAPQPQRASTPATVDLPGLGRVQLPTQIDVPGLGSVRLPSGAGVEVPAGPLGPSAPPTPTPKPVPVPTVPLGPLGPLDTPNNAIDPRLSPSEHPNARLLPSYKRPEGWGWFPPGTAADAVQRHFDDAERSPELFIKIADDPDKTFSTWGLYWKSLDTPTLAKTVWKNLQLGADGYDPTLLVVWQSRNKLKADGAYGKVTRESLKQWVPRSEWPTLPLQWA